MACERIIYTATDTKKGMTVNELISALIKVRDQEPNGEKMRVGYDEGHGKRPYPIESVTVEPLPLCRASNIPWVVTLL
jgi:hypothetical protein